MPTELARKGAGLRWAGYVLAWLAAMTLCLHTQILSGLNLGFGDRGDGLIEIGLLEHWNNVLHGHGLWNAPLYFHPYADTLGYNDGYVLFGLVYATFRPWFDPFVSDTLNVLVFKTIGFGSALLLARQVFRWDPLLAAGAAVLFSIANSLAVQAVHAQLQSIALLPLLIVLAAKAVKTEVAGAVWLARAWASGAALLTGLWLLTCYYLAWFALFFAGLFVLAWLFTTGRLRPGAVLDLLKAHGATLAIALCVFVLSCAPFLLVYLPKAAETGQHRFIEAEKYLVTPYDPINVGPGNLVWGWINQGLGVLLPAKVQGFIHGEHETGFPLVLFVLFVLAARRAIKDGGRGLDAASAPLVRALTLAILAGWLLTLQLGPVSPWRLIFWLAPGAKGLRAVLRFQLFLVLPVLILVVLVHGGGFLRLAQARPLVAAGLALVLALENVNLEPVAQLRRDRQLADLAAIPAPPRDCKSFALVTARPGEGLYVNPLYNARYPHNVDAMLLAQLWRLPTINGYSTFNPPDWDFDRPLAKDYATRVQAYAARHDLHGLCLLDMRRPVPWTMLQP